MSDVTRLSAVEVAEAIASKQVSAVEVAQAHLDRIEKVDGQLHAFLHVDAEGALAQAAKVDAGELTGPLAGVPLALKDVIVQRGVPTTVGSRILEGWRPPYDAAVVERLKAAGVVILGAVAKIGEVGDAEGVQPMTHAVPIENVMRPDVVTPSLDREEVLAAAPAAEDGRFRVPRILDEE